MAQQRRPDARAAEARRAGPDDAAALTALERAASLAALGHVFPPDEYPYPTDEVRARWDATLAEPGVSVVVLEDPLLPGVLAAFVAVDGERVRHLAVHPRRWGHGFARRILAEATALTPRPRLWVLEANTRARGLYEHLGWVPTGRSQQAEWPPHPTEIELALDP